LKTELASDVAVSVTNVPDEKVPVQTVPHDIPAGEEIIVPMPPPARDTARVYCNAGNALLTSFEWTLSRPDVSYAVTAK
jgi:hypothetical protein